MTGEPIHLVLGDCAAGVLGEAMAGGALAQGEILRFRDIYCLGPLQQLGTAAGPASRAAYWGRVLAESSTAPPSVADFEEEEQRYATARAAAASLPLLLWTGAHSSSQLWLQRLCAALSEPSVDVRIMDATAAGRRTFTQFEPGEVAGLLSQVRLLDAAERTRLGAAWRENAATASGIRRWHEGRISHHGDDHYDTLLLAQCDEAWQPAEQVAGSAQWECDEFLGDLFFAWRLRSLARTGRLLWRGPLASLADAEVRLAGAGHG